MCMKQFVTSNCRHNWTSFEQEIFANKWTADIVNKISARVAFHIGNLTRRLQLLCERLVRPSSYFNFKIDVNLKDAVSWLPRLPYKSVALSNRVGSVPLRRPSTFSIIQCWFSGRKKKCWMRLFLVVLQLCAVWWAYLPTVCVWCFWNIRVQSSSGLWTYDLSTRLEPDTSECWSHGIPLYAHCTL